MNDILERRANIISLFETAWMLPPDVVARGVAFFEGYLQRTSEFMRAHEFFEANRQVHPAKRALQREGATKQERLLGYMGVEIRESGVAVVPVFGVLMKRWRDFGMSETGTSSDVLAEVFETLMAMDGVRGVVLDVDSPGGTVSGTELAAQALARLAEEKPTLAVANELMASGAYYIASQAGHIMVTPTGVIGSIGVIATRLDRTAMEEDTGLRIHVVTAGETKADGHPSTPFTDDERDRLQHEVNVVFDMFRRAVRQGRGLSEEAVDALADGSVAIGSEAVERGFADSLGSLREAVRRMEKALEPATQTSGTMSAWKFFKPTTVNREQPTDETLIAFPVETGSPAADDAAKEKEAALAEREKALAEQAERVKAEEAALAKREKALAEREIKAFVASLVKDDAGRGRILPRDAANVEAILLAAAEAAVQVTLPGHEAAEPTTTTLADALRAYFADGSPVVRYDEISANEPVEDVATMSEIDRAETRIAAAMKEHGFKTPAEAIAHLRAQGALD